MIRVAPLLLALSLPVAAAGCGGGERQDADEPRGTWTVDVVDAKFPERQRLAQQSEMVISVRNRESRPIPNVAVTVEGFERRSEQPGLADPNRPVWVIDDGPRGGVTAYTSTWALGRVPARATKTFRWRVTPVQPGAHEITYRVAAGLDGKAKARLAGGGRPEGRFEVQVSRRPSQSRVDPETGEVIRDGGGSGSRD